MLNPEDNVKEDGNPWVVLDYDFWQRRFGGDSHAIDRKIALNGSLFTIVGVARSGFTGTMVGSHPAAYDAARNFGQQRAVEGPKYYLAQPAGTLEARSRYASGDR